jgi:biopolymer transport protein ExbD
VCTMRPEGNTAVPLAPRVATVLLSALLLLSGCYVPSPKQHATLHITGSGQYILDDRPVSADELSAAITKMHDAAPSLLVEIHPSPRAAQSSVDSAVGAVKQAHALVAFAKEQ